MSKIFFENYTLKYAINSYKKMVKKLDLTTNEKGEITSPTYVEIVSKIRHGPISRVKLHFNASNTKFSDLAES